jgi:hypothetical protein
VVRHRGERAERRKGLQVVPARRLGERDDARTAVARGARRVEGDVPVARARGEQEEVDAARVGHAALVRGRVGRVGEPGRVVAHAARGGEFGVQPAGDLGAREVVARPHGVGGRVREAGAAGRRHQVLVHHHEHEVSEVLPGGGGPAGHGGEQRARRAAGGAAEQEGAAREARGLGAGEHALGERVAEGVGRRQDVDGRRHRA